MENIENATTSHKRIVDALPPSAALGVTPTIIIIHKKRKGRFL
jgi:hypothetical protein